MAGTLRILPLDIFWHTRVTYVSSESMVSPGSELAGYKALSIRNHLFRKPEW